ncbi:unnamed protein product [Kuraishia capsulata CBS 1993]|uniref:Leukotriene A(4) hydrolase n=1 Tax=Kuraishia capsulata CBS 1993 TaxID=1382522 RepID=W6MS17_9ASCO|nr:uncharacterized protein KUCA_T00005180001 [Kuraishia capsulata CBS 1993]CDK29193.1 unnamed protein product [Kuraishia capsulata CBS 1993]
MTLVRIARFLHRKSLNLHRGYSTMVLDKYPNISPKLAKVLLPHLPKSSPELDYSTLSNYHNFKITKTTLDLEVSFDKKALIGQVGYQISRLSAVESVILDTAHLDVKAAYVNGRAVDFTFGTKHETLGTPLIVSLPETASLFTISIDFETTAGGTALQWLDPPQTDGGKLPYLFSQCEPIHARSFFPCFDTPSIKSTYAYNVTSPLPVLVAARAVGEPEAVSGDRKLYKFEQPVPIPSYLVAMAAGDLVGARAGPRSQVFSEPCVIDRCTYEFEKDMENFIETAEKLVFDYEWETYNVLVLNRAMPFGGMENPNMTFVTPTLISGNRENVDVIAHELAHSWAGNLVTNCSWDHFWLNEGWTVYLERRIMGALHGEQTRHLSAIVGWTDLENSIRAMGKSAERFSTLVQDLKDQTHPDDAFSSVPYEKGFCLLYTLEQTLGGFEVFDPFLSFYFSKYKYKSLDTFEFLDTLYGFFSDKTELLDSIDWNTWLYAPGLPPKPKFDTTLVDECYSLAQKWVKVSSENPTKKLLTEQFSAKDIAHFKGNQNEVFLDTLVALEGVHGFSWASEGGQLALSVMESVYSYYAKTQNAEYLYRWLRLQLTGRVTSYYTELADWLGTVGRMKFVRPAYVLLDRVDRDLAIATFRKYEMSYHPICRSQVKKDLGL